MVLFSNRAVICARRKVRTLKNMYNVQCTWSPLYLSYPNASCLTIYMPGWPLSTCRPFPLLPVFLSSTCIAYKPSLSVCPRIYLFIPSIPVWPLYVCLTHLYLSFPHFVTCLSLSPTCLPVYLIVHRYLFDPFYACMIWFLSTCLSLTSLPAFSPSLPV